MLSPLLVTIVRSVMLQHFQHLKNLASHFKHFEREIDYLVRCGIFFFHTRKFKETVVIKC